MSSETTMEDYFKRKREEEGGGEARCGIRRGSQKKQEGCRFNRRNGEIGGNNGKDIGGIEGDMRWEQRE